MHTSISLASYLVAYGVASSFGRPDSCASRISHSVSEWRLASAVYWATGAPCARSQKSVRILRSATSQRVHRYQRCTAVVCVPDTSLVSYSLIPPPSRGYSLLRQPYRYSVQLSAAV